MGGLTRRLVRGFVLTVVLRFGLFVSVGLVCVMMILSVGFVAVVTPFFLVTILMFSRTGLSGSLPVVSCYLALRVFFWV